MLRLQKLAAQVVLPTWSLTFPPPCAHPYPYDHMHYVQKGVLCGSMATIDISRKCASRGQVSILARKNNFNKLRSYLLTWVKALDEGKHRVHTNDSKPCFGSESIQNHANMHLLWKVELWHWTVVLQGCRLLNLYCPFFWPTSCWLPALKSVDPFFACAWPNRASALRLSSHGDKKLHEKFLMNACNRMLALGVPIV